MAGPNSQDGSQKNSPLGSDSPEDPQNDNSTTDSGPAHGQDSVSIFERYFASIYSFQTLVLSNLNRLEFKNLQLAGIRTPVSQQLQQKYLIPSKCDEELVIPGSNPVTCSNTTQTVTEIKACHGMYHDGWEMRGRQEKWIEPTRLFKHVRKSKNHMQQSKANEGGYFDSFNVCIHCRDRDRQRRLPDETYTISTFHSTMCQLHSLKYLEQRPYNICRCRMFLDKYWQCHGCSLDSMDELQLRARTFGTVAHPTFRWNEEFEMYLDDKTGVSRRQELCPILGCRGFRWRPGPLNQRMLLCRVCTGIFPAVER